MDKKVYLLIFIFLVKFQSIYGQFLFCNYAETASGYTCELIIYNPDGFDNFASVSGIHLTGKSDSDVLNVDSAVAMSQNVPMVICRQFTNVKSIKLSTLSILRIDDFSFWSCVNLLTLDLQENQIKEISQIAFARSNFMASLNLQHNNITDLPGIVFYALSNLIELNLGHNLLSTLNVEWFSRLEKLKYLYMHNNQIEVLPDGIFRNLSSLVHINLDNNNLKVINADSFGNLPKLIEVSFQNNKIDAIDEQFVDSTGVSSFNMKENVCANVNIEDTTPLRQFMRSALRQCFNNYEDLNGDHNNTIDCVYMVTEYGYTCRASINNPNGLNNFTKISGVHQLGYDDSNVAAIIGMRTITTNVPKIFCDKFMNVQTIFYIQLSIQSLGSDSFLNCIKLLNLNIWVNQIQDMDMFTFLYTPQLNRLDMRQNRITNMSRILLWPLSEMKSLNLEQNDLNFLHPDWFLRNWNLQHLNLQYNKIEELPEGVFGNMIALEHLVMNNNKLKVIHANSFGSHSFLINASFANNQIHAIDERFIDNTGLVNIDMRGNICANTNIIDSSPNRDFMKAALMVCFQNYEDLYRETTTSTVTTTQPTTTTPQCPSGNLDERVCKLERDNEDLRKRIEALENKRDEF